MQDEPLATLSSIAERVEMSVSGTSLRINKLVEDEKALNRVHVDLNHSALNLELHDFFYHIDSRHSLIKLEETIGYYHPYTLYMGRCFGKYSGLYVQYRVPKNGFSYLQELSDKLAEKEYINEYQYIEKDWTEKPVFIKSSIQCWNPKRQTWNFNWNAWKKGFKESQASRKLTRPSKSILDQLSKLDVRLLAQFSLDGRKKNMEIIRELGLEEQAGIAQKVSRRMHFLKDKAIADYRLFLNWTFFDLYQTIIIRGYCSKQLARKLRNYLLLNKETQPKIDQKRTIFPFESLFYIVDGGFFWYVKAPPSHISELMDFIWECCPKHDLFWISYKHSHVYGLWSETFDEQKRQWKLNKEFMIDRVLKRL